MYYITVLILLLNVINFNCAMHHHSGFRLLKENFERATAHLNPSDAIQTNWITQRVDNFNPNDQRTWKMRYLSRMDFWKQGGPIYLFIGGEAAVSDYYLMHGTAYELMAQSNGLLISSEHRYYGKSIPLQGETTTDLKYLSAPQAMADLVNLITTIKSSLQSPYSKVVVIGGSYPGNLAAWMRLLYPNLVHAAISSSAPVLAKKFFYEYNSKIAQDLMNYGGQDCYKKIQNKFNRYIKLLATPEGREELKREENISEETDLTDPYQQQQFVDSKIILIDSGIQKDGNEFISEYCSHLQTGEETIDYYDNSYYNGDNKDNDDYKSWIYQTCTEFGYFITSTPPFSNLVTIDFYVKKCQNLFGQEYDEKRVDIGIAHTNGMFGGQTPNVSRVVFVNGELDGWGTLGVLQSLSAEAPAIIVPGGSHCSDLYSNDPESVKAREYSKAMILKWLNA